MRNLTALQTERLQDLVSVVNEGGFFPTYRQLSERWGVQLQAVQQTIQALEKKGYVRAPKANRSEPGRILQRPNGTAYSSAHTSTNLITLPIVGETTAGLPMLAEESIQGHVVISADLRNGLDSCFILRVKGDSMTDAHILDRDLAIIQKQTTALDGDIVVARVDDEATIKIFHRNKDKVRLEPANRSYESIEVHASRCTIEGRVVGLLRFT